MDQATLDTTGYTSYKPDEKATLAGYGRYGFRTEYVSRQRRERLYEIFSERKDSRAFTHQLRVIKDNNFVDPAQAIGFRFRLADAFKKHKQDLRSRYRQRYPLAHHLLAFIPDYKAAQNDESKTVVEHPLPGDSGSPAMIHKPREGGNDRYYVIGAFNHAYNDWPRIFSPTYSSTVELYYPWLIPNDHNPDLGRLTLLGTIFTTHSPHPLVQCC